MMTREERAVAFFNKGYNCAQTVLGVFCEELGLDLNTALKLSNGFGGGVRCGELCGDLLGVDVRHTDDHSAPSAQEAHKSICPKMVASAVKVLENMVWEEQ